MRQLGVCCRPLSRRLAPPPPAGIVRRRRRRKTDGVPPSQPKLSAAAAAEIFTASRHDWRLSRQVNVIPAD